jgi:hypothetical protein
MGQRCRGNVEEIFRGRSACLEKAGVKGFVDLTYMTKSRVTNPTKSRVPQGNHRIVDVTAARAADQGGGKRLCSGIARLPLLFILQWELRRPCRSR